MHMNILSKKMVKASCINPDCDEKINFIYISLENIEENLVYWECSCKNCNFSRSGLSQVGFQNI